MEDSENPVNRAYLQWRARTPTVCRSCAVLLFGSYCLSWVLDLSGVLATTPFYVVRKYQVYRLLLSPWVGNSLLGALFAGLTIGDGVGPRLESSLGSVRLLWVVVASALCVNGAFVALCYVVAVGGYVEAVLASADGAWSVVLALVTIECLSAPEASRRLLCLPVSVPRLYYPLALLGLFSLFNGVQLDLLLGVAFGYLDDRGFLDAAKPSPQAVARCEASPLFARLTTDDTFVAARAALGAAAWVPVNDAAWVDPESQQRGGDARSSLSGVVETLRSAVMRRGALQPDDASAWRNTGRTLGAGTANAPAPADPPGPGGAPAAAVPTSSANRAALLAAAERRASARPAA